MLRKYGKKQLRCHQPLAVQTVSLREAALSGIWRLCRLDGAEDIFHCEGLPPSGFLPSCLHLLGLRSKLPLEAFSGFPGSIKTLSLYAQDPISSVQSSSVAHLCPTLCDSMDCSTPGLPVHHQLPEIIQTHVHLVGDAIQPSHPLSSPPPPALNLSQHQGLFK